MGSREEGGREGERREKNRKWREGRRGEWRKRERGRAGGRERENGVGCRGGGGMWWVMAHFGMASLPDW